VVEITEQESDPVEPSFIPLLPIDDAAKDFAAASDARCAPFSTGEILLWERHFLGRGVSPAAQQKPNSNDADLHAYWAGAEADRATALCLSGGGIRSAAFSLGVVQALASKSLLTSFDYLSTVSGGGYLGGFLQRWLLGEPLDGRNEEGLQAALATSSSGSSLPEISRLRDGATFITPQLGFFSNDSWTAAATWLRNIFVNWLLFAPVFMIVAAVPVALYWLLMGISSDGAQIALGIHFAALTVAMCGVGIGLPTYRRTGWLTPRRISWGILAPLTVAAFASLVICSFDPVVDLGTGEAFAWRMWPAAASAAAAPFLGLLVAVVWTAHRAPHGTDDGRARDLTSSKAILSDLPLWSVCGVIAAGGYLLASATMIEVFGMSLSEGGLENCALLVVLGPPLFAGGVLGAGWLFSLLRSMWRSASYLRADLDREWLVRLSAIILRRSIVWMVVTSVTLVLVYWRPGDGNVEFKLSESPLSFDRGWWPIITGLASGAIASLAGKSGGTRWFGYAKRFLTLEIVATMGTLVFSIVVLVAAGRVVGGLGFGLHEWLNKRSDDPDLAPMLMFWSHAVTIGGLALFVLLFGWVVDANRFSLNGFYRNRLSRAFLGAARCGPKLQQDSHEDLRRPDEFTGFDLKDNVRLHSLWPSVRQPGRRAALFPVINVALNAVATRRLAWQERKALPFVLTPLACGSGWLGAPNATWSGAYVPSTSYGGQERDQALDGSGVTLAAAMAISGAAASPNMGYHSSPATAFLMTLFNVRLGAWLPNPAVWRGGVDNPVERPRHAAALLLRELAGQTDDLGDDVYLSDGGHFENLGIYEMVRRRCATIVVVDGGCDVDYEFADLGNALRKIAIDLNVGIEFDDFAITGKGGVAHALATITYPAVGDGSSPWNGRLLYLKPTLGDDVPLDVLAYSRGHAKFPHESTADQWYAESQFESYRSLGRHIVDQLGAKNYSASNGGVIAEGPDRLDSFLSDVVGRSAAPATAACAAAAK